MVNMLKSQQPHQDEKISAQGHPSVFNEWRGNPHITGQNAIVPKTTLYISTVE